MEFGLIGEHLGHSFSKEIHSRIADYEYTIREVAREELESFMKEADFRGINVTIPYKEMVIPYLDWIDEGARLIGAVNTVVNKDGKLYGYNTDYLGMIALLKHADIDIEGKKVLILGTGGTSKTARAVAQILKAGETVVFSRRKQPGFATYDEIGDHLDGEVIINTTPCGMYPNNDDSLIDLKDFRKLEGVIDVIYNPLRTRLVRQALEMGAKAEGGLYMLVGQAIYAAEKFLDREVAQELLDPIYMQILRDKQNVILTGMPCCGKTTIGKALAEKLGREFIDTDEYLVKKYGREITDIFARDGEKVFRDMESGVIREVSAMNGYVIATGGGAILRDENVDIFNQNGRLYFIDRPLSDLFPTDDRPLANTREAIIRRYNERIDRYRSTADVIMKNDETIEDIVDRIERKHNEWRF